LILETDASNLALAAILSTHTDSDIHPIAFHLRSFQRAELNYNVHDKELLVIVEAFKKWQHYLEGLAIPTEVFTDHKNLTYFCNTKMLTCQQIRWLEFLSQFNLEIKFCPRRLGKKLDVLTHQWDLYKPIETAPGNNHQSLFNHEQLGGALGKPKHCMPQL